MTDTDVTLEEREEARQIAADLMADPGTDLRAYKVARAYLAHGKQSRSGNNRQKILDFIHSVDYSPSVRMICKATDLSVGTVQHHLGVLEREGAIERGPGRRIMVKQ